MNLTPDHLTVLQLFYDATKIPYCVFTNQQEVLLRTPVIQGHEVSTMRMKQFNELLRNMDPDSHLPLLLSNGSFFSAVLHFSTGIYLMFGPVSPIPLTYHEFAAVARSIPDPDDLHHLYRVLQAAPLMSLTQFTNNLSLFIRLAFYQDIPSQDILGSNLSLKDIASPSVKDYPVRAKHKILHAMLQVQKKIMHAMSDGNTALIKHYFENSRLLEKIRNFPWNLSDIKGSYCEHISLCFLHSVREGLSFSISYSVFETYMAKTPYLRSLQDALIACEQASIEYAIHMKPRQNIMSDHFSVVASCQIYIQNNLHTRITLEQLEKQCGVSKRTITRHFHEVLKQSPAQYILHQKLKEAAFLLCNSSLTLVEISQQLAFSSQAHFQTAFKKKYDYTPMQYQHTHKSDFTTFL